MPVFISTLAAAHTSLWVGTENGVIICFPFNKPSVVGEETGWEVIKVSYGYHKCVSDVVNLVRMWYRCV